MDLQSRLAAAKAKADERTPKVEEARQQLKEVRELWRRATDVMSQAQ